jgi:hypothetical protein
VSATQSAELVVIGPSPLKLIGTLGLGALGMTAGSAMLVSGLFGRQFLLSTGWIFVAFVGVSAACALVVSLLRSRPRIEIGPVGFTVHALVGGHSPLVIASHLHIKSRSNSSPPRSFKGMTKLFREPMLSLSSSWLVSSMSTRHVRSTSLF